MKQKLHFTLILSLLLSFSSSGQWALGDIAFSAYGADNTVANNGPIDAFTIVLLRDVSTSEEIEFTENGWFAAGGFRTGENTCKLVFGSNYSEGSQIIISRDPFEARDENGVIAGTLTGSGLNFATGGDQVFAYDPANIPTSNANQSGFIAGIHMNDIGNDGGWDLDSTSSTTSSKPSVFTDGVNSVSVNNPEVDNARISLANCSNFTNIATLRTMLNTASNWERDGTTAYDQSTPVCNFKQVLSIDEEQILSNSITLTPNPVKNQLRLTTDSSITITRIELYNITGQNVLKIEAYSTNTPIDMSNMETGIYLCKVYSGNNTIVKRVVKK